MPEEVVVATADLATTDVVLTIGPQHPATHGVLRLALSVEGEQILSAEPLIGYMHRGAEKLFEARDFRQILVLANRHDWLSAFSNELGIVLAVERMLGIEVPARAVWIRTMLAELNRVLNHLVFLAALPPELVGDPPLAPGFEAREAIQQVMEAASGGRMHYMFNQVGGLKAELPTQWLDQARVAVGTARAAVDAGIAPVVRADDGFRERARGAGVLPGAVAEGYGASGPVARASGLDIDLRRDDPYLAYADLPPDVLRIVTRTEGDCLARYECLLEQVEVSLDIVEYCAGVIGEQPDGPVNVRLPKVLKTPLGETYAWTENPLGINGYYLVSRGERTPWRLKLRTASFNNVQVLREILPGTHLGDLAPTLCSLFFVTGDLDK